MIYGASFLDQVYNKGVMESNDDISNSPNNNEIENRSLFIESLYYLADENRSFEYNILSEGIITTFAGKVLKDQLNKIDPIKIVCNILKGFLNILLKIWHEFEALCMNLISKADNIKKYKSSIEKYNKPVYFYEGRYIYTNIREDTSYTNFKMEMTADFSTLLHELELFKSLNSYSTIDKLNNIKNASYIDESFYNELRGKTIGSQFCTKDDYGKELYKYFRDGQSSPLEEGDIQPNEIKKRLYIWEDYKSTIKVIKKYKDDIESCAKNTQNKLFKLDLKTYIKDNLTDDAISVFSDIINNYIYKVKNSCDIFIHFYSAKLDAAKEEYSTNTKILFAAVQNIVKEV